MDGLLNLIICSIHHIVCLKNIFMLVCLHVETAWQRRETSAEAIQNKHLSYTRTNIYDKPRELGPKKATTKVPVTYMEQTHKQTNRDTRTVYNSKLFTEQTHNVQKERNSAGSG